MADVKVREVRALRDDVLLVRGDVDGVAVEASGWVSALTNHFPPAAYDEKGHRDPRTKAREMTKDEAAAYVRGLLVLAAPKPEEPEPAKPDELPALSLDLADLVDAP